MKTKFGLMWRVAVALVLVLSFSLVAAVPVAASPDVSDVWVDLDGYAANTSTTYHVYFTPSADLAKNVDTITVFFPIDTVPTDAVTVTVDPDGDAVVATTDTATADVAGYRLEVTTPVDITAGNEVRLDIPSVTNPATEDDYTLNVYTSQETTQVESSSYNIGAGSVGTVGVDPTTGTAGAADEYTIDFNEGSQGKLAVWDTVTVIFPTGTGIPSSIAPSKVTIQSEDMGSAISLDVAPVVDGRFVTLTVPEVGWTPAAGGSQISPDIQIVFLETAGITNPTYASSGSAYIGKVYTSDDLGIEDVNTGYDISAASVSQVAFDAASDSSVVVSSATVTNAADLKIQTKDQYGNLKNVPAVNVVFELSSTSSTGSFDANGTGPWTLTEVTITNDNNIPFCYKDTTVGPATITAENAAHGWSDTWEIEVTSETAVELWDGDTLVGEYTTITAAIGDALAGNVIKAGPGTYVEDISVTKADLTLESTAGAATTLIEGTISLGASAGNFVLGGAAGKGFTLKGANKLIWLQASPSDVEISYNTLDTGDDTNATFGILIESGDVAGLTVTQNSFTVADKWDGAIRSSLTSSISGLTVTDNDFTGADKTDEASAIEINKLDISSTDTTISDNTMTAIGFAVAIGSNNATGGLITDDDAGTLTISDNTFDAGVYGVLLINANATGGTDEDQNIDIKRNTFTSNTYGIAIDYGLYLAAEDYWDPEDFTVKYNDFSGNTYAVYNNADSTTAVDATHNYWGDDTGPSGDAISAKVNYEPWLLAPVSAGEWVSSATSLDAQTTVGVKVSGVDTKDIGAARYTANPVGAPEFTPLENGFFDVYVSAVGSATEIGIKFYDAAITSDSVVYVWDAFEEVWKECSDQAYNATYGYIWVKVRKADATVPTVPTISDLTGTPFAISGEEAPPEFDPMDYDADGDGAISKSEALTSVTDYFAGEITKAQALEVIALYFAS